MVYGYDDLVRDTKDVSFSIGKSLFNRDILAIKTQEGKPRAIIVAGTHGRESISSLICVEMMRHSKYPILFIPMLNPDGVMLTKYGIDSVPKRYRKFLLKINNGGDFSLWKANGRGVDINVNFDAGFSTGLQNIKYPASENFVGTKNSEPETRAIINFILENKFNALVSLHSKGDLIYYGFKNCKSYEEYVKILSENINMPYFESLGSAGGLKDWFLQNDLGFAVTIELGDDSLTHPIGVEHKSAIYNKVKDIPKLIYDISEDLWKKNLCYVP